jgi:hypothetical protein
MINSARISSAAFLLVAAVLVGLIGCGSSGGSRTGPKQGVDRRCGHGRHRSASLSGEDQHRASG